MARTKQTARSVLMKQQIKESCSELKDPELDEVINTSENNIVVIESSKENKTIISTKPKTKTISSKQPREKVSTNPSEFDKATILELNKYLLENGVPVPSKGSGTKGNVVKKDLIALAINIKEQQICNVTTTSTCSTTTTLGCTTIKPLLKKTKIITRSTFQTLLIWSRDDRENKRPTTILISETIVGLKKKMFDYIIFNEPEDCWSVDYNTKQEFINYASELGVDDNFSPELNSVYVIELIRDTEI